ncbi:MAG: indolepyruvate ferredoxin oxidoreductase subunit alpha [Candidatus Aenigmatarchaeota archaeon]
MHRVLEASGKKVILLGNEAVVRGALEAGVGFATTYPGTPASEIGDTFSEIAKDAGIYFEYSVNEKVATEAAAGAAWCGVRSLVSFKHFGLNVAADSVYPIAFHGVKAGMVIVVADDPGCWSSGQSEQDSRWYARLMHIPMLEPSNPEECKSFTKLAFELSERFGIPVFIRLTTRVSHASAGVRLGKIVKGMTKGKFVKGDEKWHNMPPRILTRHNEINKKLAEIREWAEEKGLNQIYYKGSEKQFGIIANGAAFNYVMESLKLFGLKIPVLKLNMTWPFPEKTISRFIKGLKSVLIVEELEPIIEKEVEGIAKSVNPRLKIHGKDILPEFCELRQETVDNALARLTGARQKIKDLEISGKNLSKIEFPKRTPTLCPGCPHRATFWEVKAATTSDTVFGGDIGCYILGIHKPIEMQDFIISMGAVQGLSHGISKVSDKQQVVAFIGDSTFFHAGIPGLINIAYNSSSPLVVVLDNFATAMTGHQPHPGTGETGMGEQVEKIKIEDIATACGIKEIAVIDVWDVKGSIAKIREMLQKPGPKLVIARGECRLQFMRRARRAGTKIPTAEIDPKKCSRCSVCVYKFGCPAIHRDRKKDLYYIDPDMCWGCGVCISVCPFSAISFKKEEGDESKTT